MDHKNLARSYTLGTAIALLTLVAIAQSNNSAPQHKSSPTRLSTGLQAQNSGIQLSSANSSHVRLCY